MRYLLLVVLLLAGCAGLQSNPNLSADQLKAMASDKNATVLCSKVVGAFGTVKTVYVVLDQRVISDGTVTTDDECKVGITNLVPQKPAAAPVTPKPAP
jgi:hypothetical protein